MIDDSLSKENPVDVPTAGSTTMSMLTPFRWPVTLGDEIAAIELVYGSQIE